MIVSGRSAPPGATRLGDRPAADELRQIFERPEFDRSPSTLQRLVAGLGRQLERVPFGTVGRVLVWIVVVALAAALARVVVRAARRASARRRGRAPERSGVTIDDALDDFATDDPAAWRHAGDRAVQASDWNESVRCRYGELVALLIVERLMVDELGRTTGEISADVRRSRPTASEPMIQATDLFERVWFGSHRATQDDHAAMVRAIAQIAELAQITGRPSSATVDA